jgi:L-fucose mutarotase
MQVGGTPAGYRSALQREVIDVLQPQSWLHAPTMPRPSSASRSTSACSGAFAIVQTGELQPYGNFIFKKGVIGELCVRP